ncbi:MAG: glycine--tRNA ligase [Methanocellales archaeon]|nr:glycine--tRNA ligase [Methanocellales archaeon]MDD3420821.1 glycine--tRNA ligase [Methanocellales archaeon]MDD4897940.1 glycine--tRNA ligase [Methanocellales archaeon]MDD5446360.1 glycine--tRNA ligase [Methanocellales archaeon]
MDKYERVIELAKRRGFLWPSFEIYGSTAGFWDFGPLGAALKRRIKETWRDFYVIREGFYEIETPAMNIEEVFVASGHVENFTDLMVECKKCGEAFKVDLALEKCPECGGSLGDAYAFNLMFKTSIGPGSKRIGYLRPETAQGMFVDFHRILRFYRDKLPFGVAQIGKVYRNEISPRQGTLRLREFTIAEVEIFIDPRMNEHPRFDEVKDIMLRLYPAKEQVINKFDLEISVKDAVEKGIIKHQLMGYHIALIQQFLLKIGLSPEKIRFRQHKKDEIAHYASDCWDAEALTDRFGWTEIVGIANRGDYDLKAHAKHSQTEMTVFTPYEQPIVRERIIIKPNVSAIGRKFKDRAAKIIEALRTLRPDQFKEGVIQVGAETIPLTKDLVEYERVQEEIYGEGVIPHVIEPSYGIDRIVYVLLEHSFEEETIEGEKRVVLRLPPNIAPVQGAVLPLLSRDGLDKRAREIECSLRKSGFLVDYDESGTIGRRYRRHDEIGTPFAITIDHQTLEDDTLTIRERDSMKQIRVPIEALSGVMKKLIAGDAIFENVGTLI